MINLRHNLGNVISVFFTMIKLSVMKVFYRKNLYFKGIERFSPNVVVNVDRISKIQFGRRVSAHSRGRITAVAGGNLIIGDRCSFNVGCIIVCRNKIQIGDNVTVGPNVMFYDHNHIMGTDIGVKKGNYDVDDIVIGENTWIGAGSIILAGTKIGRNCVIAAGSVVSGDIPENTVLIQRKENYFKHVESI